MSGSYDKTLKIWNTITKKCELTLRGHSGAVQCCNILPDNRIISGSTDYTLKVWNIKTDLSQYTCDLTLKGHSNCVICCEVLFNTYIVSLN